MITVIMEALINSAKNGNAVSST